MGKADKGQIDIALGEFAAFDKLTEGLRHAAEACRVLRAFTSNKQFVKMFEGLRHSIEAVVEISTLRSDPRWMVFAVQLEKLLKRVSDCACVMPIGPTRAEHKELWNRIETNFLVALTVARDLFDDAAADAVRGMTKQ
jgi:hypothetical protein